MARKAAARLMGKAKTPRKAITSRENGAKGGRPREELTCSCPDATEDYKTHAKDCGVGRALYMRWYRAQKPKRQNGNPEGLT
jgi:hypothetical protein